MIGGDAVCRRPHAQVFPRQGVRGEYKWVEKKFAGRDVNIAGRTADEHLWLISVNGDTEPGEVYLYEPKTKQVTLQYRLREKIDRASLASMKPVRFKSSDGLEISGYLTLPKGLPAKGLPTLVFPHGGPWARDFWGFNPYAQFFANRGYAVLAMNFRGSTGYGKKFLNAGMASGPQDAGRCDLGREVSGGGRHRGSEADRHNWGILWRIHDAGGVAFTPTCIARRSTSLVRQTCYSAGVDSGVLGGGAQANVRAHGGSEYR